MLEIPSAILTGRERGSATSDSPASGRTTCSSTRSRWTAATRPSSATAIRSTRRCSGSSGCAVDAADATGIDLSVCGEMAGDPVAALALVGLGIRSLSMSGPSLPAVRRAIRGASLVDLQAAADKSVSAASAAEVRSQFKAFIPGA